MAASASSKMRTGSVHVIWAERVPATKPSFNLNDMSLERSDDMELLPETEVRGRPPSALVGAKNIGGRSGWK